MRSDLVRGCVVAHGELGNLLAPLSSWPVIQPQQPDQVIAALLNALVPGAND